jgi:micrococcal nuclease
VKSILVFILLLTLPAVKREKLPEPLVGKVVGVLDGDTIDLLYDGKTVRVRLEHIDCPEIRSKQPFGAKAKQFTSDHCFGKQVRLKHRNRFDRNNRLIAVVILPDGKNLNYELVKAGLAWHFVKYSSAKEYAEMEELARKSRVGLWSEKDPTPPWQWRTPRRSKN